MSRDDEAAEISPTFTGQEAAYAQTALRGVMGLPAESFSLQAFIGMISDEIEQLRAHGFGDAAIADLPCEITDKAVSSRDITSFYAGPESRRRQET